MKTSGKVGKVMHEFKAGTLHSGSKHGPKVTKRKQAVAIALSEARKQGAHIPEVPSKSQKTVHHSPTMLQVDNHKTYACEGKDKDHRERD